MANTNTSSIELKFISMTTKDLKVLRKALAQKQLKAAKEGRHLDVDKDIQEISEEIKSREESPNYMINSGGKVFKNINDFFPHAGKNK